MASQEGKRGVLSGIARDLAPAGAAIAADDEQLEMLSLPTRFDAEDAARAEQQRGIVAIEQRARGVGRPKGARNKTTRDLIEYARKIGADPMLWLLRWAQHTPVTLAAELGCTRAEAWDRLYALHRDIRRVFIADAVPVDEDGKPLPQFSLSFGGGIAVQVNTIAGQKTPPWLTDPEVARNAAQGQQNQALTLDAEPQSHDQKSHGVAK